VSDRSQLRCESCGETSAKTTCVSLDEVVDLSSGKGTANLVQKCKFCTREGSIVMVPGQGTPLTSELSQKGEKACLMVFECRGCEPIEFDFGNGWKVESVSIY
jgi:NAD-dependent SIR2 family protein deacetylase